MKIFLIILLCFVMLASCGRKMIPPVINTTKDSIVYQTKVRDTTIYMPGAVVEIRDSVPYCDEDRLIDYDTIATSGNVKLHVNITKGKLTASCKSDSLQKVIRYLSESLEKYSREKQVVSVPMKVPVRYIPKWVWYLLGVNILFAVWTFRNPLIAILRRFV